MGGDHAQLSAVLLRKQEVVEFHHSLLFPVEVAIANALKLGCSGEDVGA